MKGIRGIELLLTGAVAALIAVMVPLVSQTAYAADVGYIERLVPAESQEVEVGGGETPWASIEPFVRGNDTGRIGQLLPAESQEVEVGGGETPPVSMEPFTRGHDTGKIELLLPAE